MRIPTVVKEDERLNESNASPPEDFNLNTRTLIQDSFDAGDVDNGNYNCVG